MRYLQVSEALFMGRIWPRAGYVEPAGYLSHPLVRVFRFYTFLFDNKKTRERWSQVRIPEAVLALPLPSTCGIPSYSMFSELSGQYKQPLSGE